MARVPLKEGLLSSIEPGSAVRLLAGHCPECSRLHFPAGPTCPLCAEKACGLRPIGERGTLSVYTAVLKAPPGYRGRIPYGFGVVELPEGIRVVSRLTEADPERMRTGMPVALVLEDLFVNEAGDTVVGWAYAPEET